MSEWKWKLYVVNLETEAPVYCFVCGKPFRRGWVYFDSGAPRRRLGLCSSHNHQEYQRVVEQAVSAYFIRGGDHGQDSGR